MSNKVYDVLKWIALVFLPAFIVLVGVILNSLNVANANIIITILTAIDTFLGSILGISNINYNKKSRKRKCIKNKK